MQVLLTFAIASAVSSGSPIELDATATLQVRRACAAPVGTRPTLPGVKVEALPAAPDDLPYLRITDFQTGSSMRAYYDTASRGAAWSRAACFGMQLRLIDAELGDAGVFRGWHAAVFTTTPDYAAPTKRTETRWHIETRSDGTITPMGQRIAVETLPHEQVHAFQNRFLAKTPRWFGEGHAEWVSRKVVQVIAPESAAENEREKSASLASLTTPVSLLAWGGLQVKREAIMRQVTPAERQQMLADPKFYPSTADRSFRFEPGDVISDEGNTRARYQASWRVFHDLEAAHGQARVRDWANAVTGAPGQISQALIVEKGQVMLKEDLSFRLK